MACAVSDNDASDSVLETAVVLALHGGCSLLARRTCVRSNHG
jgi:hypothetical protein